MKQFVTFTVGSVRPFLYSHHRGCYRCVWFLSWPGAHWEFTACRVVRLQEYSVTQFDADLLDSC